MKNKSCDDDIIMDSKQSKYYGSIVTLSKDRNIFLSEDVTKEVSDAMLSLLIYYDHINPSADITIYINSNGGDADALINMVDIINMISAPVRTICIGKAFSAGAVLLSAGTKGKRLALKNSCVMIHGIQSAFPLINKTAKQSELDFQLLELYNNKVVEILAKTCGKTVDEVLKDCKEDLYLSAQDAINYGLIDAIV